MGSRCTSIQNSLPGIAAPTVIFVSVFHPIADIPASVIAGWVWTRYGASAPFGLSAAWAVMCTVLLWVWTRSGGENQDVGGSIMGNGEEVAVDETTPLVKAHPSKYIEQM